MSGLPVYLLESVPWVSFYQSGHTSPEVTLIIVTLIGLWGEHWKYEGLLIHSRDYMSMNLTAVAEIKGKMVTDMTFHAEMTRHSSFLGLGSTGKKGLKSESTSISYDCKKVVLWVVPSQEEGLGVSISSLLIWADVLAAWGWFLVKKESKRELPGIMEGLLHRQVHALDEKGHEVWSYPELSWIPVLSGQLSNISFLPWKWVS